VEDVAEVVAREAVLRQVLEVIAFAPTVVKELLISWVNRVMSRNALSAALP